jgi:hypothetical protein
MSKRKKCKECDGSGTHKVPNEHYIEGIIQGCFGGDTGFDRIKCSTCNGTGIRGKS